MFNGNPLGPNNFNEGMIDRLLGKAYLTIKEVHDNLPDIVKAIAVSEDSKELTASVDKLAEILKDFDTSAGMFLGHDLGEVGEPTDSTAIVGDNYLSEFTKSATQIKTVGDNIDVVNRLVVHINELKAIAEALTSLLAVKDALPEITKSNKHLTDIKLVANSISDVHSVKECLSEITTLAENINYFPEIINSADDISKVAKYLNSLVVCAGNIATYIEANERLKTAQEVIANDNIATVANNVEVVKEVAAKMSDIDTLNSLDPRITSLEVTRDDHEQRITTNTTNIADHEKRISNIETSTDVGQFATRLQAIEDKNEQQDTALTDEVTNRQSKDDELDAKDTALENALKTEKQEREQKDTSIENKNTEQDERLDAIENKNTEQDASIKSNATAINANASSLSGLNSQVTDLKTNVSALQTKVSLLAIVPTGTIIPFAGSNIPNGYLLCNGSAVSRTSYANLFEVISTLYGEGDGSTTFNLPDLRDRFLEGAGTNALGTYLEAGLPNIIGTFSSRPRETDGFGGTIVSANGAFAFKVEGNTKNTSYTYKVTTNNILPCDLTTLNATLSSAVYSASKTVQPKSLIAQYLIKY